KLGRRMAPLSLPQGVTGRYILFASVYLFLRPAPEGRNGACIHSPNSCAPLYERPTRRGRRWLARVHRPVAQGSASAGRYTVDLIFVRLLFVLVVGATCYVIEPFNLTRS